MKLNGLELVQSLREFANRIWQANDPVEMFVATPIYVPIASGFKLEKLIVVSEKGSEIDILPMISWVGYRMTPKFSRTGRTNLTVKPADRGEMANGFTQMITQMLDPGDPGYDAGSGTPVIDPGKQIDTSNMTPDEVTKILRDQNRRIVVVGQEHFPNAVNEYNPQIHSHTLLLDGEMKIYSEMLPQRVLVIRTQKPTTYIMVGGVA
jgi:hypothetical protein